MLQSWLAMLCLAKMPQRGSSTGYLWMTFLFSQARAKNEATFRVADQGGWQPDHVPIDAQQPLQSYLNTDLPVSTIAGNLPKPPFRPRPINCSPCMHLA